jgi:hypothetical protein
MLRFLAQHGASWTHNLPISCSFELLLFVFHVAALPLNATL